MSENAFTTIRITKADKKRFRGYARHPRATDDEVMTWILDKLEEPEEFEEANNKFERKKEEY